jgi:hypothetical protein
VVRVSGPFSRFNDEISRAQQSDADLGELSGRRVDLNRPAMLLDDNVVADREAKTGALSGRLCGEEGVEHLVFDIRRNASAVIADLDFHAIAKIFGRGRKNGLVIAAVRFIPTPGCGIKAI